MIKVSIIIPIYNTEKYLPQCLQSAMSQTLREIEIICIDDGSSDDSLQILRIISKQDRRIRIITKSNSGYGHTMNIGIEEAEGKYLIFLESDDYILPNLCETLYELCEEYDLEILKTDFFEFKEKGGISCSRYRKTSDYNNYCKVLNPRINTCLFFASMYTWSCMYKREFILKNRIRHHETPGASYQDNGFWFQTLMHCQRMYLLDQAFYMYRQDNPNSSIHSKGKVYAFSEEYAFIRKKIGEYSGDKKEYMRICAFFNLHHNMTSLKRVDKKYSEELLQLILNDFLIYRDLQAWDIKELDTEFAKKLMLCLAQPQELKDCLWDYIDKNSARNAILERYDTYILYGAGVYAQELLTELEECKFWNKNIFCGVTSPKESGEKICGIEIEPIQDLLQYKDTALVIICARKDSENYIQMCEMLEEWGVQHIVHSKELIVKDFWPVW